MTYWITVYAWESVSLIDWISDTLPQEYTDLQSLLKCLDHICMIQSIKGNLDIACFVRHDLHGKCLKKHWHATHHLRIPQQCRMHRHEYAYTVALLHCCTVALLHCCTDALLHKKQNHHSTQGSWAITQPSTYKLSPIQFHFPARTRRGTFWMVWP